MGLTPKRFSAPEDQVEYYPLSPEWRGELLELLRVLVAYGDDKFFHPHPFTLQAVEERLTYIGKDLYFVQTLAGKVVGYGMLRGWDEGYSVPSLGIAIHPKYRGQGLGGKLMRFLHDVAKNMGVKKIRLTTYSENIGAIQLYQKMGYKFSCDETGRLVGYFSFEEERK